MSRIMRRSAGRVVVVAAALLSAMLLAPATGTAGGPPPHATITSTGPVTEIALSRNLHCNARYAGDEQYEFFGGLPGSCGVYIARGVGSGSQVFAPGLYIEMSQSLVTGAGSSADPFRVDTTACAGTSAECSAGTAPLVTTTVRYVVGQDFYRTDVRVTSRGAAETIGIYQYADCFLQDSDSGYGFFDSATGGIYCSAQPNNAPPSRIEGFVPINPGSSYHEAGFSEVANQITSSPGAPLPNSCECAVLQDNGMALGWTGIALPASGSAQRSFLTAFSPTGVEVDPAPTVTLTSPAQGSQSTDTTPTYGGAAGNERGDSPTVTVEVYQGSTIPETPPLQTLAATRTSASWSIQGISPLPPGTYTARARQTDTGGNEGISAPRTFTVLEPPDVTAPETTITSGPTGTTSDPTPTFAFTSSEAGSTFQCRVDSGVFAACTSPHTPAALADGTHTFSVRATDRAQNTDLTPATRTFTVNVPDPPPPPPPPPPVPPPTPPLPVPPIPRPIPPPPPDPGSQSDRDGDGIPDVVDTSDASGGPTLGRAVVATVVSGEVFVRLPGAARAAQVTSPGVPKGFVALKGAERVPVGSVVNTRRGRVKLASAGSRTATGQRSILRSDFYDGIFQVKQQRRALRRPVTDILVRSSSLARKCGSGASGATARSAGRRRSKRVVSRLWGNGKGRFRTRGRHSAGTVRGTIWLTEERCDGTRTFVRKGSVTVRDLRARRTVVVRAGQSYLARAQRATIKARRRGR